MQATHIQHNPRRAEIHAQLQQVPQELTIPVVGIKLRPRDLLAQLIAPSPSESLAMMVGGLVTLTTTVPFSHLAVPGAPLTPAEFLSITSIVAVGYGGYRLCEHVMRDLEAQAAERIAEQGRAEGAASQQRQLQRDYVEVVRFEGGHPGMDPAVRAWMMQARCSTWTNPDGSLSIHIPKWNIPQLANLRFQGPTTPVQLGEGYELQVPTALLGNART